MTESRSGRDVQPVELVVVAGVDDRGDRRRWPTTSTKPAEEPGGTDTTGERREHPATLRVPAVGPARRGGSDGRRWTLRLVAPAAARWRRRSSEHRLDAGADVGDPRLDMLAEAGDDGLDPGLAARSRGTPPPSRASAVRIAAWARASWLALTSRLLHCAASDLGLLEAEHADAHRRVGRVLGPLAKVMKRIGHGAPSGVDQC